VLLENVYNSKLVKEKSMQKISKNPVNHSVCETVDQKEILNRVQNDSYEDLAVCHPCKIIDTEEILNQLMAAPTHTGSVDSSLVASLCKVQNDSYGDMADCHPRKIADREEILNQVQNDSYGDMADCHPRKIADHEEILNQLMAAPTHTGSVDSPLVASLCKVQNDRKAVVEFEEHDVETLTRISNFRKAQIEILPSHKERGVTRKTLRKKAAFTLAEVLIAIGIVGIVSALTIPNLIHNYQKRQTVVRIKKAISLWKNASRLSREDLGDITDEETHYHYFRGGAVWKKYYAPYISASRCDYSSYCGYGENTPWRFSKSRLDGLHTLTVLCQFKLTTNDGYFFQYFSSACGDASNQLIVDINATEGPNIIGKDVFFLDIGNDFNPLCSSYTDTQIDKNCPGYCCAEKIRRAGWVIDKSYEWNY
jgi:prepilin-type N-terminal cleavage/methylation domain-containing protein